VALHVCLRLAGLASPTVPMYIAECAPSHQRGKLVTTNNIFITGGQFVASIVAGIFSYDYNNGWRYVFSYFLLFKNLFHIKKNNLPVLN